MKIILRVILFIVILTLSVYLLGLGYLNFYYLPKSLKPQVIAFLSEKSGKAPRLGSVYYLPTQGLVANNLEITDQQNGLALLKLRNFKTNLSLLRLFLNKEIVLKCQVLLTHPAKYKGRFELTYDILTKQADLSFRSSFYEPYPLSLSGTFGGILNEKGAPSENLLKKLTNTELEGSSFNLSLESNLGTLNSVLKFQSPDIKIEMLSWKVFNSYASLFGDIQNIKNPSLNLYGDLNFSFADLEKIYYAITKTRLADTGANGELDCRLYARIDKTTQEVSLKGEADSFSLKDIEFNSLKADLLFLNQELSLKTLSAECYSGKLQSTARLDLKKDRTFSFQLRLDSLDLEQLNKSLNFSKEELSGKVFLNTELSGKLGEKESWQGASAVNVAGAKIMRLPLLKGLAETIKLPRLREATFKQASADFLIFNQRATTENLTLTSDEIIVYAKGSVNFNGDLDFLANFEFPQETESPVEGSSDIEKIIGVFSDQSGSLLGEVRIGGNIKSPKYQFRALPTERIIKKGLDVLFENISR